MTNRPIPFPSLDLALSALQMQILHSAIVERSVSRGDIARRAKVSLQTVMRAVLPLVEAGLLDETAQSRGGRGQPERNVVPVQGALGTIGVSIRAGRLHVVLQDVAGEMVWSKVDQQVGSSPSAVLLRLEELLASCAERVSAGMRLLGQGVSAQGFFADQRRVIISRGDPAGWAYVNLGAALKGMCDLPLLLENDARVLAGNYLAQNPDCLERIFLLLDSGIGGAIISGGRLLRGDTGNAGELGALIPEGEFRPTDENMRKALRCGSWDELSATDIEERIAEAADWFAKAGALLSKVFYAALATTGVTRFTLMARAPEQVVHALSARIALDPIGHDYIPLGVPPSILASPTVDIEPMPALAVAAAAAFIAARPKLPPLPAVADRAK